jgi:hypothetical protein
MASVALEEITMAPASSQSSIHRLSLTILVSLCALAGGLSFTSTPALALLPDGRVYEAVSPVASEGGRNAFVPIAGSGFLTTNGEHGILSARLFEAADDGDAVAYSGEPPPTGGTGSFGSGSGDQYLSRRSAGGGWTQVDIQRSTGGSTWGVLSSDLSTGIVSALGAGVPAGTGAPENYPNRFLHATAEGPEGIYQPFYTVTPPNRSPDEFVVPLTYGGSSADGAHQIFQANDALTNNALDPGPEANNLYDSVHGALSLVNVLPGGTSDANATFGAPALPESVPNFSRVVSNDGSRIFWTDLNTEVTAENPTGVTRLFVRLNASEPTAQTVQADAAVGGGGTYSTASTDGSKVFFTKEGDLYEYNVVSAQTVDLAEGGDVQGLLGASEDGSYVYFVAAGALAPGATAGTCKEAGEETVKEVEEQDEERRGQIPTGRACNLYVSHAGSPLRFIAALPATDNSQVVPFDGNGEQSHSGGWRADIGNRTAYVSPDGRSLMFMSNHSLSGYDNEITFKTLGGPMSRRGLYEVFLYEAAADELRCVSCDPSGAAPVATNFNTYGSHFPIGGFFPITKSRSGTPRDVNTYQPRVISKDGSRVFFDSGEPLVPEDINGWLDVYEWERNGSGSCRQSQGCIYLLSGGTDPDSSYLIGASASGDDVFMITRAQLVSQDRNDNNDVYDARVGGVQLSSSAECPQAGCERVTPPPPVFATPPSVAFNGVGNFPPISTKPVVQSKPKSKLTKCKRGYVKKKGKCVKKPKAKKSARGRK